MMPHEREALCNAISDLEMLRRSEVIVHWSFTSQGGGFQFFIQCAPDVLYGAALRGEGGTPGDAFRDLELGINLAERAMAARIAADKAGPS